MFFFPSQSTLEPCSLSHEAQGKSCLYFILPRSGKISRGNFGKCCQCGNVASYHCCQFSIGEPVASGAAVAGRPPYPAARRDASPHQMAATSAATPASPRDRTMPCCRLLELAQPLGRVTAADECVRRFTRSGYDFFTGSPSPDLDQ